MCCERISSTTGVVALTGALLLTLAPAASADQVRDAQWPLTVYDAEKVWRTSQGTGVTVAVVDSGVDASHPDLTGQVLPGKDFTGDGDPHFDENGHGTGMASLIAGHGHGANGSSGVKGLAPKAKILPVRVSSDENDTYTKGWAVGVRYAVDQGASVINLSLNDENAYPGSKVAKAIAYAQEKDVVVVAGAGNDAGTVNYPAALPGVVAVSAVDQALNFWSKSNTGKVTVAAPGVRTPQADPTMDNGYAVADGTSGSTAYVSAIVALLRSKYPDLTAGQIINRLVKSASFLQHAGKKAPDRELGFGIARPGTALTMNIAKGPKQGPLIKGSSSTSVDSAAGSDDSDSTTHAKKEKKRKSSSGKLLLVGGVAAAVVIVGLLVAVLRGRRNGGNNGGPGAGGGTPPPGYGYQPYPNTAPGQGYPPHSNAAPGQGYPAHPGQGPQNPNPYS